MWSRLGDNFMTMQFNDDDVPLPNPELMKKWREAALRDFPTPQDLAEDFADLIAAMRWASELGRIGAANKDLPDRLTSTEYMLRALLACFSTIPVWRMVFPMKRLNKLPSAQRSAFKVDAFCDAYGPSRSTL